MYQSRTCKTCGATFKGGPRAYYCPVCRAERQREQSRLSKLRKRTGKARPIGSTDACERCGQPYVVAGGLQRYCKKCAPLHAAEYDRVTAIAYYHANKEFINPPRYERRKKGPLPCHWCGKEFDPAGTCRIYCSGECRRLAKNKMWRERYYKK